jgi:putative ABC transport system substrate-binding protein
MRRTRSPCCCAPAASGHAAAAPQRSVMNERRAQLVTLAARDRIPAAYVWGRDYPAIGGLMSYGTNPTDAWRQVGVYAGNILKGAKPAELPVQQAVKFDFVINRGTATLLGIEVPSQLLAIATEVIE